jgi:hypothetical protein
MSLSADHELVDEAHGIKHPEAAVRDMWLRRIVIAIVTVIVLVGATGMLGVRSGRVSQSTGGIDVELTYARVARPGLAVPFRLGVEGLDPAQPHLIAVELSSGYVDSFDFNNLTPDPESVTRTPDAITYEFAVDEASAFEMAFDTRVEPAVQSKRSGLARVTVDAVLVAELDLTTWIAP